MEQWYHSGIEGYCKAAAKMMGLPNDASGWGNFGRDLFGDDRFDDPVKASRTWTLSRSRKQSRSNRPTLFEKSWLGRSGADCETAAVSACARSIADASGESMLHTLYQEGYLRFATGFSDEVLPAIADGFRTERYHSADILRFSQGIDELLGALRPSSPSTFTNFVTSLVAALIYGPGHPLARVYTGDSTILRVDDTIGTGDVGVDFDADESSLRITQLFNESAAYLGYSELFGDEKVIFLGRGSDEARYREKCNPQFAADISDRQPVFYPIANTHKRTSNEHGAIARLGDTWYYHDFSTNGSYVENGGAQYCVHGGIAAIQPGDRLHLGLPAPSESDEATYQLSTALLISFNVDEAAL